jgi:hypothetical protein
VVDLKPNAAAIADLKALGIDSAEMRWLALCDYLNELRTETQRAINSLMLVAEFLDLAEMNAKQRGSQLRPGLCECGETLDETNMREFGALDHYEYWLCDRPTRCMPTHYLVGNDYLTAQAALLKRYKGKAAERAREITTSCIPIYIREFLHAR